MSFDRETAVEHARRDLADRLSAAFDDIRLIDAADVEFPDMALGAAAAGEMAAQMISEGWRIELASDDRTFEYRADKYQLRLYNFEGKNYVIVQ